MASRDVAFIIHYSFPEMKRHLEAAGGALFDPEAQHRPGFSKTGTHRRAHNERR
jgi:hypothetical protein